MVGSASNRAVGLRDAITHTSGHVSQRATDIDLAADDIKGSAVERS